MTFTGWILAGFSMTLGAFGGVAFLVVLMIFVAEVTGVSDRSTRGGR